MTIQRLWVAAFCALAFCLQCPKGWAAAWAGASEFHKQIEPVLKNRCYDCHGDGSKKGDVSLDSFGSDQELIKNRELWLRVLKNVRAGLMPPEKKPRPTPEEKARLENWIKSAVFQIDPKNLDPGRVTVRRLNRTEYRNTIRDLMGVDYNTELEFPPDDTGYGFDNIGDVLTVSPMLLEKYLAAAKAIVTEAVPTIAKVRPETVLTGKSFRRKGGVGTESGKGGLAISYYKAAEVTNGFKAEHEGRYRVLINLTAIEKFVDNVFDYNKCQFVFKVDGKELQRKEYTRGEGRAYRYEFDQDWAAGPHELVFEMVPLTPNEKQERSLEMRINSVTVQGPADEKYWTRPKEYGRFFTQPDPPTNLAERRAYAGQLLGAFAKKAFRRPVDNETVKRLVALAERNYKQPGQTFENGVAQAMVAVLASPRFLFREEASEPGSKGRGYPLVDEYSLASRLSYFLWSSMPDDELFRLAAAGELRKNQAAQVERMMADPRSQAFIRNFTGQWLEARDIENVEIDSRVVLAREDKVDPERDKARARLRELRNKEDKITPEEKEEFEKLRSQLGSFFRRGRVELNGELRQAMRQETEKYFEYIVRQDRPVSELIESDYTFLNERLAKHYGIEGVTDSEMRLVKLPPNSPRGGILGQGTFLVVTANPTRTSPVKRGLFLLDNVLGMAPPPPPPNIPPLEDAAKEVKGREPTLRETLELHRDKPLCNSCHSRMDPLGLALENFNAMGMWREKERDQPIDVSSKLITGESFSSIQELKHILATRHREDFYRCLTEKLLVYAVGRGLEYYDVGSVDEIVNRLNQKDGKFSAILAGVIESSPFQKRRESSMLTDNEPSKRIQERAEIRTNP